MDYSENEKNQLSKKRLLADLQQLVSDNLEGFTATPTEENIYDWEGVIFGPPKTSYENGIFELRLHFPNNYPFKPPKINFVSQMYHPNIYPGGAVCMDILQSRWSPHMTVSSLLLSIQSLLNAPEITSPANPDAASTFLQNPSLYHLKVRNTVMLSLGTDAGDLNKGATSSKTGEEVVARDDASLDRRLDKSMVGQESRERERTEQSTEEYTKPKEEAGSKVNNGQQHQEDSRGINQLAKASAEKELSKEEGNPEN